MFRLIPMLGVASEQSADQTTMVYSSADAITWLSSSNLLAAVMTSVCDLETILQKACQGKFQRMLCAISTTSTISFSSNG